MQHQFSDEHGDMNPYLAKASERDALLTKVDGMKCLRDIEKQERLATHKTYLAREEHAME